MQTHKELQVVELMIKLYCRKKHHTPKGQLCQECAKLLQYAQMRRQKCPFGDNKPFCSNCKIHCYKADMREKIREVMRFAGPRMIFSHPILAIKHVAQTKRQKLLLAKANKTQMQQINAITNTTANVTTNQQTKD